MDPSWDKNPVFSLRTLCLTSNSLTVFSSQFLMSCLRVLSPDPTNVAFISGWWLTYPSEKYEVVSWDDEIPNIWKNMEK